MSVKCEIKNYKALKKQIEDMRKAPKKVLENVTKDAKKRAPGWIAAEITKHYGVKKGEITGGDLGKVKVNGKSFDQVRVIYSGRMLTPTHFSMKPVSPTGGAYTLKATIIKGQRKTLGKVKKLTKKQRKNLAKNFTRSGTRKSDHSPVMLMPTGSTYIPFQRKSAKRTDVEAVKTLSLPQMVSSERTHEGIQNALNDGIQKRLDHHMKRFMGK